MASAHATERTGRQAAVIIRAKRFRGILVIPSCPDTRKCGGNGSEYCRAEVAIVNASRQAGPGPVQQDLDEGWMTVQWRCHADLNGGMRSRNSFDYGGQIALQVQPQRQE